MKIKRSQAVEIVRALRLLPGAADQKTRYAVSKALILLGRIDKEWEKFRIDSLLEIASDKDAPGIDPKAEPEKHRAFLDVINPYLQEEIEIPGLLRLSLEGLNTQGVDNAKVAAILEALEPVLDVDTPADNTQ